MFGVSILTWGTEAYQSNPFIKPLWAYQFGGSTGHAAIKLVLPIEYADLVEKYCTSEDDAQYIPHFKTKIFVPEVAHHDVLSHTAKEVDAIVVYFSVWPGKNLKYEFQDRFNGLFNTKEDSPEKNKSDVEHSGTIHHSSPLANQMWLKIENLEADLLLKIETYENKVEHFEALQFKLYDIYLNRDDHKKIIEEEGLREDYYKSRKAAVCASNALLQVNQQLVLLKNEYYEKHCQYGASPAHEVFLPLAEQLPYGLDAEAMLAKMRSEKDDDFDFDLFHNNCSNFTRAILTSGVTKTTRQALAKHNLMSSYDLSLALFDAPVRVLRTAMQAQVAFSKLNALALCSKASALEKAPAKTYLPAQEKQITQRVTEIIAKESRSSSCRRRSRL